MTRLGRTRRLSPMWLAAGMDPAVCVAAYTPAIADSLADSYINRGSGGSTYNCAAPVAAPTWALATGWHFTAANSEYLTTGVVPLANWSWICRYSGGSTNTYAFGSTKANAQFFVYPNRQTLYTWIGNSSYLQATGTNPSGTLGTTGNKVWINGKQHVTWISGTFAGSPGYPIWVGAANDNSGSPLAPSTVDIQYLFIYQQSISPRWFEEITRKVINA